MVRGFVPDHGMYVTTASARTPGEPKKSFWTGTKLRPHEAIPITALRCEACGFIDLYAGPKLGP